MARPYRKNFFRTNKYQRQIIYLIFISSLVICLCSTILLVYINIKLAHSSTQGDIIEISNLSTQWTFLGLFYMWVIFIVVNIGGIIVSSQLVGPFERIIRELHLTAERKKKTHIITRSDDRLAQQFLKPINLIIDHINKLEEREEILNKSNVVNYEPKFKSGLDEDSFK